MVDTPRTQAFILTNQAQDGQADRSYTLQRLRDLIVSLLNVVPASVSAAGTTQGTATVLVSQVNVATTVASLTGVVATAGYTKIWNAGLNDLLVYPISGAQFDLGGVNQGTNIAVTVPVGGAVEIAMTSSTQGYAR